MRLNVTRRREAYGWAGLLAAAVFLYGGYRWYTGIVLEDALITYRYAANLAAGHGWAFNPGEEVLGTTTPLFTLVLAGCAHLFGSTWIPLCSNIVAFVAVAAAGLCSGLVLRRAGLPRGVAFLGAGLFLFHRDTVWIAAGGMETPLVLCWMAVGLLALQRRAHTVAALSCALLVLTRLDGVFWSAAVFLVLMWRTRTGVLKYIVVAAVPVLAWVLYAWWHFGNPVPHSVLAKRAIVSHGPLFSLQSLGRFFDWIGRSAGLGVPPTSGPLALLYVPPLILFCAGLWRAVSQRECVFHAVLPAFWVLFAVGMYVGRAPHNCLWYLLPATWAALQVATSGFYHLWSRRLARRPALPWVSAVALLAAVVVVQAAMLVQSFGVQRQFQANEDRTRKAIGLWLKRNAPAQAVVAMEAIGYQGTYAEREVLDLGALISPAVAELYRQYGRFAEVFYQVVVRLQPDFIVLRRYEVETNQSIYGGPLFASEDHRRHFEQKYETAVTFRAPYPQLWGENAALVVFRKRASASPE